MQVTSREYNRNGRCEETTCHISAEKLSHTVQVMKLFNVRADIETDNGLHIRINR